MKQAAALRVHDPPWAQRVTSGESLFEVLPCCPKNVPAGVDIVMLPRTTTCLAYMVRNANTVNARNKPIAGVFDLLLCVLCEMLCEYTQLIPCYP